MEVGFVENYRNIRRANYARFVRWMEGHETVVKFGVALAFALLTAALAQISLHTPLTPVPFTMQVLGISLMGGFLGARWGAASALMYLAMGLVGLPVFEGQMATYESFQWWSGAVLFTTKLSAWYLVGFVAQAWIVGLVAQRRTTESRNTWLIVSTAAAVALAVFGLLDVYFLTDYAALYGTSAFPNASFLLLGLGVAAIAGSCLWLSFTTKARRERIELFAGNMAGLLALYAIGATGLYWVWGQLGYRALSFQDLMAYAVIPFIPVDIAKILVAIGLLTLVRPTQRELASEARAKNV